MVAAAHSRKVRSTRAVSVDSSAAMQATQPVDCRCSSLEAPARRPAPSGIVRARYCPKGPTQPVVRAGEVEVRKCRPRVLQWPRMPATLQAVSGGEQPSCSSCDGSSWSSGLHQGVDPVLRRRRCCHRMRGDAADMPRTVGEGNLRQALWSNAKTAFFSSAGGSGMHVFAAARLRETSPGCF